VDDALLEKLLSDPFYKRPPPKTAGREQYGREFVELMLQSGRSEEDLLATATVLTAVTIAQAIQDFGGGRPDDVLVSGGGVHNGFLMEHLKGALPGNILRAEDFGIPGDAKEAVLFALLAYETFHQRPSNIPAATGARSAVLGKVCYAS
jgi:anhydro-N-acetylmuramic acid kinase